MNDMVCLYIGGPLKLIRRVEGHLWYNYYEHAGHTPSGGWSMPNRYYWIGQPCIGVWKDDC